MSMKFDKIHNKGQARLFKSPFLEYLTRTHPLIIWGMYIPVISYLLYYAYKYFGFTEQKISLLVIAGMLFWTFFEYMAHRYLFHMEARGRRTQKVAYILHGNHHEFPRDRHRLFMPAVPSIILSSIIFLVMYLLMGRIAFTFFPGFIFGYLMYASMHYAIHAWNPPFKWLKPLWRNHHLHHYKEEDKGFGVSSNLWDYVFHTNFDLKNEKEDKEKVQALMFEKR